MSEPNADCRHLGPWKEQDACHVVRDWGGQALAYFRERAGAAISGQAAHLDEARQIAVNIAKLPELSGAQMDSGTGQE
jgi:hypothetical protein